MKVRSAVDADWPALLRLWVEAWTAFLPSIDFEARLPWFRGHLAELRNDGAMVLVAAADDVPVGFATVDAARQDMDQLVTAPAAQRRGVARLLLRDAKMYSPYGLDLKVLQINQPAIELYRGEGFTIVGEGFSARSGLPTFHMRWSAPSATVGGPEP